MTVLISAVFLDDALNFKAPKGMMYFVESINFTNNTAVDVMVTVKSSSSEDVGESIQGNLSDIIANFDNNVIGTNHQIQGINEKCKFISITKDQATDVVNSIVIYGELVKASKTELLWEWFRKGR